MKTTFKKTAATLALMAGFALPSAALADVVYTNDTDISITDNTEIQSDIIVGAAGSLASITVTAGIDHTYIGDLRITLVAADGTELILMNRPGLADNNSCCGFGNNISSASPLVFDDAAGTAAESAQGGGTYAPDESLAALLGSSVTGTWSLLVADNAGLDQGRLDFWSLNLNWEQAEVPEPAALGLMGLGLVGMGFAARRRKAK